MAMILTNPILPGFYPDPSICRSGDDFYIVNSSFAYFPGLPLFHSKDLAHWEQVGNVMERASQLPLEGCGHSQGLFAPTIRFHKGTYYVICTNVSGGGNFIVTALAPEGPWSEPHYLQGAEGIDPSLFFDEDGKCYYVGTHANPQGCRYDGDWYIWIQELDLQAMKLINEPKDVWNGAMREVVWPEGPHIYKKDEYYYIMHAEGGTGSEHAICICRSRNIFGPYENNRKNPILTHRHLGKNYPIQCVGHGDLVETPAGDWYMVMLAIRPQRGYTTLGRETFLAEVVWEDDWPVVNPGIGTLTDTARVLLPEWNPISDTESFTNRAECAVVSGDRRRYDFAKTRTLGDEWLFLRNPEKDVVAWDERGLLLMAGTATLREQASPSYVGIRQQHKTFRVTATLRTEGMKGSMAAGVVLLQNQDYQLRLEATEQKIKAILAAGAEDTCLAEINRERESLTLFLKVCDLKATVGLIRDGEEKTLAANISIHALSTEEAGGFVGCTVGIYAVEAENRTESSVCFEAFTYDGQNENQPE